MELVMQKRCVLIKLNVLYFPTNKNLSFLGIACWRWKRRGYFIKCTYMLPN